MLRKFAERISRGVVLKRRLPAEFNRAVIYVSPDAALAYWKPRLGEHDPHLLSLARQQVKPGSVVWDIGANVGLFSFAAAELAGPKGSVLAVEPDIWLAQLLRRSARLARGRGLDVQVLPAAIADTPGALVLTVAVRGRAANVLEVCGPSIVAGGTRERQLVPTLTLDLLLDVARPPDLLKIDVEGAEIFVLRGATRLLNEIKPIVYCEVDKPRHQEAAAIFKAAGYKLFDGDAAPEQRRELDVCTWNTLACPG